MQSLALRRCNTIVLRAVRREPRAAPLKSERARFEAERQDPDRVFRLYFEDIYRYCRVRCASDADAEDIASQVFADALRALPRLRWQGKPVLALLYTIAGRRLTDHRRRHRATAEANDIPQPGASDGRIGAALTQSALLDAIGRLPDDQRVAVYLRVVTGRSFAEVAAILGRSEKAAKQLAYRGLEQIRRDLVAAGEDP